MREELDEFKSAGAIAQQADAMVDLIYLAIGTLVEIGVPPGRVFELVHAANMGKRWPDGAVRLDGEGKVLKPPAWSSPDSAIEAYVHELSDMTR
jgi:predicted HAD superfamily Cof-like phosphohydrolase